MQSLIQQIILYLTKDYLIEHKRLSLEKLDLLDRINNLNTLAENKKKVHEVHKEGLLKIKNNDCKNICLLKRAILTLEINTY